MKQIIVVSAQRSVTLGATDGIERIIIVVVFWFAVTAGKEVPLIASQRVTLYEGGTEAEKEELRAGRVIEEPYRRSFNEGVTQAEIRQALLAAYAARESIHAEPTRLNLAMFIGASFEDGTWRRAV